MYKFKKEDIVKLVNEIYPDVKKNSIGKVLADGYYDNSGIYYGVTFASPGAATTEIYIIGEEDLEKVDYHFPNYTYQGSDVQKTPAKHKCTCTNQVVFSKGCQCGGV